MRKNLSEWEDSLKPYFGHINLLGEIPITQVELEHLGILIRDLIKRSGQVKATRKLETYYCRTFAVFLAATAAHNTDRDYWRVVSDAAGLPIQRMSQLKWGEIFLGILEAFSLPTFQDVGGYRFVNPIRLHGGIPAYSLPDFFAYILWPAVKRDSYKRLPTEEILPILLKRSTVQVAVDSPVTNFLQNGDEFAIEFFDHCRKMARLYIQSQEVPAPDEIHLPPYVVRTFQQWVDEELETDKGRRLRAPRLYLDPWGPDFYLHMPPETVEGLLASRIYFWRVELQTQTGEKYEHIERVRVHRRGYDLETSAVDLPLENPSQRIIVSYCCQETISDGSDEHSQYTLRRWRIDLLPNEEQIPLVAFRPTDGRILRWNQTLPAEELWLLFPSDVELQIDGEGHILEYFPNFTGYWGEWNVQSWDLSKANALKLVKNGKAVCAPIPVLSAPPDPILVGDNLLVENVDPDDIPLYIGQPPWIRFPVRPGRSIESELSQWHLNIESRWAASPVFHHKLFRLDQSSSYQREAPNAVDLPLKSILGERVCGTYWVIATGPYGMRTEFRFRVWPEMTLEGLEPFYLPVKESAQTVRFIMELPHGCDVHPQAGVEGVIVKKVENKFEVSVDPDLTVADLHLVASLPDGDPIRLPLSLAIPRLRWSLLLGHADSEITWTASPIQSTAGAFLQAEQATLYFDLPLVDELPLIFNIILVNPENGDVLQEHTQPKGVHFRQTRWRFPLGEFSDTIRYLDEQPVFEFQLAVEEIHTKETLYLPVLRLSRTLDIQVVWIEFLESPTFCLRWLETKPLRNRRVRIWSVWKPWNPPTELKIPDDAKGELIVSEVRLPPSQYRMHFFTAAPWDPPNPPDEPPEESLLVETTTPEERLRWISKQLSDNSNRSFLLHFERACIQNTRKDFQSRDQDITWCYQHLSDCTPDQISALHRWLGSLGQNFQKAVRLHMYRPDQLKKLFAAYPKPHPKRDAYLEHFTVTPLVKPASAVLVLENVSDPGIVMHSLIILVKREHLQALNYIFSSLEAGQLSDPDAGELLALNPDFTLPALGEMPESPVKLRLIQRMVKLIPEQEYFVLKEFWVRTNAGWGCINKIVGESGDRELRYFNRKVDNPMLHVTLRPQHFPENVVINLSDKTINFLNANKVFVCTKDGCNYFASERYEFIRNEHNRASHTGLGPAFRPLDTPFRMFKPVIYSIVPPQDQFA